MKTIHIYQLGEDSALKNFLALFTKSNIDSEIELKKNLIKDLYENVLKKDNNFHYFYEPDLIIRISSTECVDQVKNILINKKIKYIEYDYPLPKNTYINIGNKLLYCYGEQDNKIVLNNLDLFTTIFHAHSIAAITLNKEDHFEYMERTIHTRFNPKGYTRQEECDVLVELASYKGKISDKIEKNN